jgi:hypothetical protein
MGRTTVASDASSDAVFHDSFRANNRLARITRTKSGSEPPRKLLCIQSKFSAMKNAATHPPQKIAREPKRTQATDHREQQQGDVFRRPEKS